MKKIAIYGKGGIGKSTVTSNLSAAMSRMNYKVMQIGCDPKADSTLNLLGGQEQIPVLEYLREKGDTPSLKEIVSEGFGGVCCIESGGPSPGIGCAGRGIITTFQLLDELDVYDIYKPDFIFYDILGDVVCGGFAAPIRDGYADEVLIVTSGEKMALYAAKNIIKAVNNFKDRGYASVRGIVLNRRNIPDEENIVKDFSQKHGIPIIGDIPRDVHIQYYENQCKTVVEGDISLNVSRAFMDIAHILAEEENN